MNLPLSNQKDNAKSISQIHFFEHVTRIFAYSALLHLLSFFLFSAPVAYPSTLRQALALMLDFQTSTPGFSSELALLQLGVDPTEHARLMYYPLFIYFLKLSFLIVSRGGNATESLSTESCYAQITAYSLISAVLLFPWPPMPAGLHPALNPASNLDR